MELNQTYHQSPYEFNTKTVYTEYYIFRAHDLNLNQFVELEIILLTKELAFLASGTKNKKDYLLERESINRILEVPYNSLHTPRFCGCF